MENALLPPLPVIREQLARNQRERRRLRTLLRWAIDDIEAARAGPSDPRGAGRAAPERQAQAVAHVG